MKVLVIGAGMYVTGRGTPTTGTILPSIAEASRSLDITRTTVCSTRDDGALEVAAATRRVNAELGTSLHVDHATCEPMLARLSEGDYDCAIVSVPDHLHYEITCRALEVGLHCLVVKPFTPTLAEGRRLVELQERAALHGCVEFHKRYDESNLLVKRWMTERCLGRLSYADVAYSQRISIPRDRFKGWAARTNIFQYLGVHYVDLLAYVTGLLPTRVKAIGTRGILTSLGIETYDSVHAWIEYAHPDLPSETLLAQFSTNWIDSSRSSAMSDQRYRIVGERGRIECDQKNRGVERVTEDHGVEAINPYFSQLLPGEQGACRFTGYGFTSIFRFLSDVADLRAGRVSARELEGKRPTFREALASTGAIEAANWSLEHDSCWRSVNADC